MKIGTHLFMIAGGLVLSNWCALRKDLSYRMLKNYMKEGQKLPLFGVGPYIVYGMAMVNLRGMLILPLIDWAIMTFALIHTEEKWLLDLYGDEYAEYKRHVNRCIPWKRR